MLLSIPQSITPSQALPSGKTSGRKYGNTQEWNDDEYMAIKIGIYFDESETKGKDFSQRTTTSSTVPVKANDC
jgi:hypothetical protein